MKKEIKSFLSKLVIKPRLTSTHTDYANFVGCSMLPSMFNDKYNKVNQYILDTRERIAGHTPPTDPVLENIELVNCQFLKSNTQNNYLNRQCKKKYRIGI